MCRPYRNSVSVSRVRDDVLTERRPQSRSRRWSFVGYFVSYQRHSKRAIGMNVSIRQISLGG
jgi:hypothetical protein